MSEELEQKELIPFVSSDKSMEEQINDLGATIYQMTLMTTHNILQNNLQPTKEELLKHKNLQRQYSALVKIQRSLKKSNKVGDINEEEFETKFKDILSKKSSMPSIVQSLNQEEGNAV